MKKVVFITGLQGVGKTTLGRNLFSRTGFSWIDLDQALLENHSERSSMRCSSIRQLFLLLGKERFRTFEKELCLEILHKENDQTKPLLFSLGGGSHHLLKEASSFPISWKSIYLFQKKENFFSSMMNSKLNRSIPAWLQSELSTMPSKQINDVLEKVWNERHAIYEKYASHVFDIDECSLDQVEERFLETISYGQQ